MKKYTLVALPEKQTLGKLNAVRTYLYTNGFRYQNNLPKNDVHITLAELATEEAELPALRTELQNILEKIHPFGISYDHVTNKIHPASEKYPNGSAWIALYFKENRLRDLAQLLDLHLISKDISTTKEYVAALGINPEENLYSNIANHMNLCNYARVEKAQEAKDYVEQNAPKSFVIDKVALRDDVGSIIWSITLTNINR
ncbi:MAG: hypothetical protein JNK26_03645 [Candidatus Doudnabacteria bacterium]|nr:hypothetical protein [Candidatus Doudnabacteria bacterium]